MIAPPWIPHGLPQEKAPLEAAFSRGGPRIRPKRVSARPLPSAENAAKAPGLALGRFFADRMT